MQKIRYGVTDKSQKILAYRFFFSFKEKNHKSQITRETKGSYKPLL